MIYDLGIVIPVYRSRDSVKLLTDRIRKLLEGRLTYCICLVDDSADPETSRYLERNCGSPETTVLVLDRNYGQQAATLCGLEHIDRCQHYATIDDDLEQPPQILLTLYDKLREGYDIVYGVANAPQRALCRRIGSRMRDGLFSLLLGVPDGVRVSSLRVMTGRLAEEACRLKPGGFFYLSASVFKGSARPVRAASVSYVPESRREGESGYSLRALMRLYWKLFVHYAFLPAGRGRWDSGSRERIGRTLPGRGGSGRGKRRPLYRIARRVRAPRLLILGGSNCQLHAFARARERGIATILADYTEAPAAAVYAGLHEPVSTFDVDGCIRAAKEHHVDGVMTMGTDQPVYTAACVSAALGLPALLAPKEALAVTNKRIMKQVLKDASIPAARYRLIRLGMGKAALDGLSAPFVIKPLDSQGQRGIFRLDTPGEVFARLSDTLSYSREEEALVEEYYESTEITVSGWISGGILTILTVTDRLLYPDTVHIGVCIGHRFPTVHMDRYAEIEEISRRTAAAFRLKEGPFYLQLLVGKEGILVNELASRIGGAFEDVVIPYLTGFDILDAVIRGALGQRSVALPSAPARLDGAGSLCPAAPPQSAPPRSAPACPDGAGSICPAVPPSLCLDCARSGCRTAVQLLFCRPGIIGSATPLEELLALPYVLDAGYNYLPGQAVPLMENATARFGHAVICGTEDTIDRHIDEFYQRWSVRSSEGEEMAVRLYP